MILFIEPHFTYPGGSGKVVLETAERLAQRGLDVGVLTLSADKDIIERYPHIQYFFLGSSLPNTISHWLTYPDLMRRINKAISQIKVEVLFPHVFPANYWGFLYKRQHRDLPCIWYCHEPSAFVHNMNVITGLKGAIKYAALLSNPLFQLLDRRLVRYADKILVNSHYTATQVERIYHRHAEVVYPGVDIRDFKPRREKEEFIFTIGRLSKFKRIDLVFKALRVLKQDRGKEIKLVVGGDGEERANLMKLAQKMGLSRQVYFTGRLPYEQVKEYIGKAKAVIFPTTNEPFGLVPLEAMACGTPVIASNSGGPRETIIDGKVGFLFKPDDEFDLARKIDILSGDHDLNMEMAVAARKHVVENFSWERTTDRIHDALREFVSQG